MKTNSHSPVDGDVQALIEHCKSVSKYALDKEMRDQYGPLDRKMAEIALAALTADPVVEVTTWWPLGVDGGERPFLQPLGNLPPKSSKLYTTPPAQLLRPVELPEFKVHSNQPCWPSLTVGLRDKEWIEALRQQGYEVKND